jgi:hypothetical protein
VHIRWVGEERRERGESEERRRRKGNAKTCYDIKREGSLHGSSK